MPGLNDRPSKRMKLPHMLSPGLVLVFFLLAYNNVVNFMPRTLHVTLYVWMNLGVLCLVWLLCRRSLKLTAADLGWTRKNNIKSILYGLGASALVIVPAGILLLLFPALAANIKTPQLEAMARDLFWWRLLVHIPVGTAFFEEMLFRGIFYGYLLKKYPQAKTILITSIFFGLWHIVPALQVVNQYLAATSAILLIALFFLLLLGASLGGVIFAWIRYRTGNIAGSIVAHALIDMLSLVGALVVWQ